MRGIYLGPWSLSEQQNNLASPGYGKKSVYLFTFIGIIHTVTVFVLKMKTYVYLMSAILGQIAFKIIINTIKMIINKIQCVHIFSREVKQFSFRFVINLKILYYIIQNISYLSKICIGKGRYISTLHTTW